MLAVAADGARINFMVAGSGTPLVLVGGKTSSIESAWWRFIEPLSKHLKVVAFDNRGAGGSDKPDKPYSTSLMAEDGLAVLAAAGEESAHWFGLSLGGMIIQVLALHHARAVRSLVLAGTHCGGEEKPNPPSEEEQRMLAQSPHRRLANLYSTSFLIEHPDRVAEDVLHFGKMPLSAIQRQDQAARQHDVCSRLSEIGCPVLILHGRDDRMVPVGRAQELHSALPQSTLKLFPGGHQFHSEHAEDVIEVVLQFIRQVESRSAKDRAGA
jgi:pimeloyl-ACP methyl ester carboxylesterase